MKATMRQSSFGLAVAMVVGLAWSASAFAQPIRVLLVMPTESGRLARQISRLNDALVKSQTHIVAAPSLDAADAVVRVSDYRQTTNPQGTLQNWWEVEIKLLAPVPDGTKDVRSIPKRQFLVVSGREDWETEPVLNLLSEVIARALGRRHASAKDTI